MGLRFGQGGNGQFTEASIPRLHYTMSKAAVQRKEGKMEYHNIKRDGVRVMMGVKQGDNGHRSKPVGLINYFVVDNFITAFIRTVILKR